MGMGLVDGVVPEPPGGAHRDPETAAASLKSAVVAALREIMQVPTDTLVRQRYEKFRKMGVFQE